MIKFRCQHCNNLLNAPENYANKKLRCPKCKQPIHVPSQSQQSKSKSDSFIKFRCPGCNQKIGVSVKYAGKKVRCAKCKCELQVPSPKSQPPQPQPAATAPKETSTQDDIGFGNIFDDNAAQQLLEAESNAPEMETLRLKPLDSPAPADTSSEPDLYNRPKFQTSDSEQDSGSTTLRTIYKIPLALGTGVGCTVGAAILWTILAYFIGLSWLHFLCIPVAAAAGYGLTLFTESRNWGLGLVAVLIGLFGIFCGKIFIAKWVVLPRMENPFAIASQEFEKATLEEEQIQDRLQDQHAMFTAACFQMADDGKFDHEFAEKLVQTHQDGRAPIGEAEQITQGIQEVEATLDNWSPQQKRQAIIAQFEREKKMFKDFGRSILTAVTDPNETEVPEGVRKTAKETQDLFEGTKEIQQTKIGFAMAFIGSFSILDLIFIPVGLYSAYKVGAGKE